ncbi:hypothetical protein COU79_02085 [Candidatus Peregrinibacteria bacterium CG10_big_fil_rev_8_21_14_0_10_54_7]|nr:MAG: hypothetical protein COU79_02085 [Candidatus Peregrinibacteria bacterium CG10_big_fil_rev_8_21_14_0_10_54_7]
MPHENLGFRNGQPQKCVRIFTTARMKRISQKKSFPSWVFLQSKLERGWQILFVISITQITK